MERIVALVGRRDEPTDGVHDYCTWLGAALAAQNYDLEIVRVPCPDRGWRIALDHLINCSGLKAGDWVLFQYTALAWSRRGFPLRATGIVKAVRKKGIRCCVIFHDFEPFPGLRFIDEVRRRFQLRVLRSLYLEADLGIFTGPVEKVSWLPEERGKAVFIPIGANCPAVQHDPARPGGCKTVVVFCVTSGERHRRAEVKDIGNAMRCAASLGQPLRLVVLGRGALESETALKEELAGTCVDLQVFGILTPDNVSRVLADSDVLLFARSEISTRRGSAIAGIACGLPIVCYAGADTTWPITEAGIFTAPYRDGQALAKALALVFTDNVLRESLAARSRQAQERYFSWPAIANQFIQALQPASAHDAERVLLQSEVGSRQSGP